MAFGQPSGPPATARQLRDLTALVEAAGHDGFRDARGPLGLNQRQAAGRFTQDEAESLIARLEAEAEAEAGGPDGTVVDADAPPARATRTRPVTTGTSTADTPPPRRAAGRSGTLAEQLERVPEQLLVDELRRRGWALIPPTPDG